MWEELEKEIRLYDEADILKLGEDPFFGVGNKNAKVLILFDQVTDSMYENNSVYKSKQIDKLKIIFDYIGLNINECYITFLNKYYNKMNKIKDKDRKYAISIFLKEIYLVQPEYIVTIGESVFNYLFRYYTKKEENVDILKNVGKIFNFYGKKLIPIYDMEYVPKLKREDKIKLVNVLKEINK